MTDDGSESRLHIDSDWKTEAANEKAKLAREAEESAKTDGTDEKMGASPFIELVNVLAMQAAISLGGYQDPGGGRIPPNPEAAKHQIDMLDVLEQKTKGNLTPDEKRTLDGVLYELRMQYVQMATGGGSPAEPGA